MEEENEDSSPCMRGRSSERPELVHKPILGNRWELKKKKIALFKKALATSFLDIHDLVTADESIDCKLSGSTLTVVLVTDDNQVFTANVGDSMALLVSFDRILKESIKKKKEKGDPEEVDQSVYSSLSISTDHTPHHPKEQKRIQRAGGDVRPSKKAVLLLRSKSTERPVYNKQGRLRVFAKNRDAPGLAISRSIGDQLAHSVGVSAEPGNSLFL